MGDMNETSTRAESCLLEGAVKDAQSITSDWNPVQDLIKGVVVKEVKNVPKTGGVLVEVFRSDWSLDEGQVAQVFQVVLEPGSITAWHMHQVTTDRIFINRGLIKLVLYDARRGSDTYGRINEFRFGALRPGLVSIPPGVWHGVKNVDPGTSSLLNLVDKAYSYDDPDHWRLPGDTQEIPYDFASERRL